MSYFVAYMIYLDDLDISDLVTIVGDHLVETPSPDH